PPAHRRPGRAVTTVAAAETTDVSAYQPNDRDKALRRVGSLTVGGVAGVVAVTGALSAVSAAGFAAATTASTPVERVPPIPPETTPVQLARPTPAVVIKVVHVPAGSAGVASRGSSGISAPRRDPPASGSSAPPPPPPPPPPPACHSTPSHPC